MLLNAVAAAAVVNVYIVQAMSCEVISTTTTTFNILDVFKKSFKIGKHYAYIHIHKQIRKLECANCGLKFPSLVRQSFCLASRLFGSMLVFVYLI